MSVSISYDSDWRTCRFSRHLQVVFDDQVWDVTVYVGGLGIPDGADVFLDGNMVMVIPAEILDFIAEQQEMKPKFEEPKSRKSDPVTSRLAADGIKMRVNSTRFKLLMAHYSDRNGLTDEEAAVHACLPLTSEYATRCSELERAGLIASMPTHRTGSSGQLRIVRRITQLGLIKAEKICKQA
jgi:hypothetical protein